MQPIKRDRWVEKKIHSGYSIAESITEQAAFPSKRGVALVWCIHTYQGGVGDQLPQVFRPCSVVALHVFTGILVIMHICARKRAPSSLFV